MDGRKIFTFDAVLDSQKHSQTDLYTSQIRPLVESFVHGSNACVLTYGQVNFVTISYANRIINIIKIRLALVKHSRWDVRKKA